MGQLLSLWVSSTLKIVPRNFHQNREPRNRFNAPPLQPYRQSTIDALSDDDVYTLIDGMSDEDAIGLKADSIALHESVVHRITHDAVVKPGFDWEIFAMTYISSQTSIPIPKIRRTLPIRPSEEFRQWIVMDLIDGEPLETAWWGLSWVGRLRVIWYMRNYIRQLHSIPIPYPDIPGPFDASGNPHKCRGLYFTLMGAGPFNSYQAMADWYDRRRFDAMVRHHQRRGKILRCPKFDRAVPLVVCHMDLHLRNIIVDRNGIPWMVDWGEAGAYPPWLDYANAAVWFERFYMRHRHVPWMWRWSAPFIFGNYGRYYHKYLEVIGDEDIWGEEPFDKPSTYFEHLNIDVD